jgi:3-deoxy-D-manno-octulosonate 8-phosphate phosphatase (KDO 8-P phosphatase)
MSARPPSTDLVDRASVVRLVLFDVDGVLTDGTVVVHGDGTESKSFNIRDGIVMVWAERAGIRVGILSARHSPTTGHRAAQLGITLVHQAVASKLETYERILRDLGLSDRHVAYMGDDILDLAVLGRVGLAAAPADAVDDVRSRVHFVSSAGGGRGAARELLELILKVQHRWDLLVAEFLSSGQSAIVTAAAPPDSARSTWAAPVTTKP